MTRRNKTRAQQPRLKTTGTRNDTQYDIEAMLDDFETEEDAKKERDIRKNVLLRSPHEEDLQLYDIIDSCQRKNPCNSAACPVCFREKRKWFFSEAMKLAVDMSLENAQIITLICYRDAMTDDELKEFDPRLLRNKLGNKLTRAGFTKPVIGCLELDYHEENKRWSPHYHLITFDDKAAIEQLRSAVKRSSKRQGESTATVDRPLRVDKIRDATRQISYLCKSYSSRITTTSSGSRKTFKSRLRPKQHRLILRLKHQIGFQPLLFLYHARRIGNQLKPSVSMANHRKGGKSTVK